jgi:uncharacterized membrane protein
MALFSEASIRSRTSHGCVVAGNHQSRIGVHADNHGKFTVYLIAKLLSRSNNKLSSEAIRSSVMLRRIAIALAAASHRRRSNSHKCRSARRFRRRRSRGFGGGGFHGGGFSGFRGGGFGGGGFSRGFSIRSFAGRGSGAAFTAPELAC